MSLPRLERFGTALACGATEDHEVQQGIRAQAIGPMNRYATRFTDRHQTRDDHVLAVLDAQHLSMDGGRDPAHVVVAGRDDRDRLLGYIDPGEDPGALGDAGQTLMQDLGVEMLQVQMDMILFRSDTSPLVDLDRHRAADDI